MSSELRQSQTSALNHTSGSIEIVSAGGTGAEASAGGFGGGGGGGGKGRLAFGGHTEESPLADFSIATKGDASWRSHKRQYPRKNVSGGSGMSEVSRGRTDSLASRGQANGSLCTGKPSALATAGWVMCPS
jgi:hypothetical protein